MGFSFGIRKLSRCQSQEGEDCHGVLGFHLRLGDEDQDLVICQDVENSVPNLIHPFPSCPRGENGTIPLLVSRSFWRTHWMIHDDSVSNNINNGQKVHPISSAGEAAPNFGGEELSVFVLWIRVAEIELLGVESLQFSANLQFCWFPFPVFFR